MRFRSALALALFAARLSSAETALDSLLAREEAARSEWVALPVTLTGRVVDEDGFGVASQVRLQEKETTCDARGWFRLEGLARRNALVTVEAKGFFNELRVADLELPATETATAIGTIGLRARKPGRTRLVFGGDAMMGRRFMNPDNVESPPAPLLRPDSLAADARRVLQDVAPLLRAADLAIVNLETVISRGEGTLVSRKPYNYWTPPEALDALAWAGVDAVTLGNNHTWDYGASGLKSTLAGLDRTKLGRCGAGLDEASSRRPAELEAGGCRFRLLSYSGIVGEDVPLQSSGERGGAAAMTVQGIAEDVRTAAKDAPVIVGIHSGLEYSDVPTAGAVAAATAAVRAGAVLVVGHHPHSPQGMALEDGVLIARCLGNLVFDQTRYETLTGLLLVADFEDGRVAAARLVPIVSDGYVPRPAAGPVARWTARHVGALSRDVDVFWSAGSTAVAMTPARRAISTRRALLAPGLPARIATGEGAEFVTAVRGEVPLELGRDLLRIGGFEDGDADGEVLEGDIWKRTPRAIVSTRDVRSGVACLRLFGEAGGDSTSASTRLRVPVPAHFTITGWSRASNGGAASVGCDFCDKANLAPISHATAGSLPAGTRGWTPFAFDVVRPAGAVFVRLRLEASPPAADAGDVAFDDVAVIAWGASKQAPAAPNEWDWLRAPDASGPVGVTMEFERLEEK